jgi:hypothetical protein
MRGGSWDPPAAVWGHSSPSPVRGLVVLQELPPHMLARADPRNDRIHDASGAVHDVQWRMEAVLGEAAWASMSFLSLHPV